MLEFLKQAFVLLIPGIVPLLLGRLGASWLINQLWPQAAADLFGWVVGMLTAVFLTLLAIAAYALYRDKVWRGLMHPIAFMGSIILVVLAILSLPGLWGQLRLLAEGETAVGTVESLSTGLDYDPETSITNTIYYLTYTFTEETGESHRKRVEVAQTLYQSFAEGDEIHITYLPDRPRYSLPTIGVEPERRARRVFTYLLAVLVVLGETAVLQFFWERGLESFLEKWD